MIAKTYILQNLNQLDSAFRFAKTQKHGLYFSKLAILELCGWIETSMDEIILDHSRRRVKQPKNAKFVNDQIVRRTHGFEYEQHFRKMLISILGIADCEKLEAGLTIAVHTKFVVELNALKLMRDKLAHTYVKSSGTFNIDAPSVTKARFGYIYQGLKSVERGMRSF